jgi:hypothetical protein
VHIAVYSWIAERRQRISIQENAHPVIVEQKVPELSEKKTVWEKKSFLKIQFETF